MPKPLDSAQAADLAGISTRAMFQQAASDYPPQKGADGYPCRPFGQWLKRRHLRGIGAAADGTVYDLDSERGRLTHHQANLAALDEANLRDDLIPAELVERTWTEIAGRLAQRLEAVIPRIAERIGPQAEGAVRAVIDEALDELRPLGAKSPR
jgi:phage terminase Nu1 subunit (DNA packaging protein)